MSQWDFITVLQGIAGLTFPSSGDLVKSHECLHFWKKNPKHLILPQMAADDPNLNFGFLSYPQQGIAELPRRRHLGCFVLGNHKGRGPCFSSCAYWIGPQLFQIALQNTWNFVNYFHFKCANEGLTMCLTKLVSGSEEPIYNDTGPFYTRLLTLF